MFKESIPDIFTCSLKHSDSSRQLFIVLYSLSIRPSFLGWTCLSWRAWTCRAAQPASLSPFSQASSSCVFSPRLASRAIQIILLLKHCFIRLETYPSESLSVLWELHVGLLPHLGVIEVLLWDLHHFVLLQSRVGLLLRTQLVCILIPSLFRCVWHHIVLVEIQKVVKLIRPLSLGTEIFAWLVETSFHSCELMGCACWLLRRLAWGPVVTCFFRHNCWLLV